MFSLSEKKLNVLVEKVTATYKKHGINHIEGLNLPNAHVIEGILENLYHIIFPGYSYDKEVTKANLTHYVGELFSCVYNQLVPEVAKALCCKDSRPTGDETEKASIIVYSFLKSISRIRSVIKTDIHAADGGDPAAFSFDEIILSYPCVHAITVYRMAHELYKVGVSLIPRIMTECAHSITGIDIHPGAKIGDYFFIDHGTGVVIGETSVIGAHVKLYQGVTLGAMSFPKDDKGRLIKGVKRHPTIKDNVTIYAGATILGDVTIGAGSVVGGNVWLTKSIKANTVVTISEPDLVIRSKK
jgi:serine O-acetyltransferase